jgi:hypothetical protein
MNGYIYKLSNENSCYYGMTTRNIYKRMAQHIDNYNVYTTDKKNYCSSYEILKEGIEKCKIELIETIPDATKQQLFEKERFYIQSFECVNIKSKNKNKINTKTEQTFLIDNFINTVKDKNNLTEEELKELIKNENEIFYLYDENSSLKAILGYVNGILKIRKYKIIFCRKKINYKLHNRYKLVPIESILKKTKTIINDSEIATQEKYNDIIKDKSKFKSYVSLIKYFTIYKTTKKYKKHLTKYKIFLIHELEKELKINKLDVKKLIEDKPMTINDELLNKLNTAFRCEQKPETFNDAWNITSTS